MPKLPYRQSGGSSPRWAKQISSGNRAAFDAFFRAHYEALCRFVEGYVRSAGTAEDLVQDVFFELWKGRRSLEVEHSLKAYLYGMARHRALKYLRRQRLRAGWEVQDGLQATEPSAAALQEEVHANLRQEHLKCMAERLVAQLPEQRRLIFMLSRRHQLSYVEIAKALDVSIKTVETQMGRALKFLRARLLALEAF